MRRGGFTLIEMLVVMALMCIMYVAMYSPSSKFYQERQKAVCARNLQMIHIALKIYAGDNHDAFPIVTGATSAEAPLSLLVPRDTADTAVFICPGTRDRRLPEAQSFAQRTISYAYYMGQHATDGADQLLMSDRQVDARAKIQGEIVFSVDGTPPGRNHRRYGGNFLYIDGHVETSELHAAHDLPCPPGVVLLNPRPSP